MVSAKAGELPTKCETRVEQYRLEQLREGDQRYFVYVYWEQLRDGQLIRALLKGYRQP
jgi:hypothetical protein